MRKLLATLFTLAVTTCAFAQERNLMQMTEMPQQASVSAEPSIVLINGQKTSLSTLILDEKNIATVNVHKIGSPEAKKHDPTGKNNIVLVTMKDDVKLVQYEQIMDQFNIPAAQRILKVSINGTSLVKPDLILADLSQIEKVEVAEAGAREFAQWGWPKGEKYLKIVTKKQE